jgi:tight adherence protein C
MSPETTLPLIAFVAASSGLLLVYSLLTLGRSRLDDRLDDLSGAGTTTPMPDTMADLARATLPRMGTALVPTDEEERTLLRTRLIHAGLYGRQAMPLFLGAKMLLMLAPTLLGFLAGAMGLVSMRYGVLTGACLGIVGMIGPSFWLDHRKSSRQIAFRRALPDALDVLIICLEGGLSLHGALKRVATELQTAHPMLSVELNIAQREIQMGRSPGESLQHMGQRTDLEEVRTLASVITQAERFGASLVRSLRVHAETLREKRKQQAEEMAQKAGTKILFPTLLCIFPAIFVVILGPAVFQIIEVMGNMQR